jgi:4-amino-4-deoxy-L-arabinose transferase-like glycosyltransferase
MTAPPPCEPRPSRTLTNVVLTIILIWAAVLRLWRCDASLPGSQIDEAYNAWNAQCLLKTGTDEWGQRWPIISTRGFDDYRSPLYLYLLMPFQAVGGMNVCTTRLPAALGGVATVYLIYWLGRRFFDAPIGLAAALLLAIAPWHIQHTRWGHEGNIGPLLAAASLWALIWAGAPIVDRPNRPRLRKCILAGALIGVCCYGYAADRIFIPITLMLIVLVTARHWRRDGRFFGAMVVTLLIILAPLAWRQVTAATEMNARASETHVWNPGDSLIVIAAKVLVRIPLHFSPAPLFMRSYAFPSLDSPDGYGWFGWFMLPLMLAGLATIIARLRTSVSARVLLVLFVFFSAGDLAFSDSGVIHPIRSFPGIIGLCLTAGVGAIAGFRWLQARAPVVAPWIAAGFTAWAIVSHILFVTYFFGRFNDEPDRIMARQIDLMQACDWLRPRLASVDAVFCTDENMIIPHDNLLVYLNYSPRQWFDEPRDYATGEPPYNRRHVCTRFGKIRVMYHPDRSAAELRELASNGKTDHVVLILRPDQVPLAGGHRPALVIGPAGSPFLVVYELDI